MRRSTILFGIMCAILGATWIPVKAGVSAVPPALFAGTRFLAAGALLALALRGAGLRIRRADLPRLAGVTVLMVVLTYPLLFWGATRVGSGLAAVINLASLPVALLAIAVALDEEPWSARRAGAIGCGVLGLALLFAPRIAGGVGGAAGEAAGAAAILLSALAYALGSVAARPLLRAYRPGVVAAWTMLAGGAVVTAGAVAFEPGAAAALDGRWGAAAWASWAFLVLFGSLLAHVIYLRLVREWGASRAGAYAFVSPVVAVLLGALVYGERPGAWEAAGTAIMLSAAYSALREDQGPAAAPRHEEGHACRSTRVA